MIRALLFLLFSTLLFADPGERTPEEAARLAGGGDLEGVKIVRPAKLPDFRKYEPVVEPMTWNLGPTGMVGIKNAGWKGDQVRVMEVRAGSPADGKVLPGDVILGFGGRDYQAGTHMGVHTGNAIIKAEEPGSGGKLHLRVWRDRNWSKRTAAVDVKGTRVDNFFEEAEAAGDLYDWKDTLEKTASVGSELFDKFPPDSIELEFTLQLATMGTYSDTSPWDCEVAAKIRENAWAITAPKFTKLNRNRKGTIMGTAANSMDALAMVASGKPEHRKLVADWVKTGHYRPWRTGSVTRKTWAIGFWGLDLGVYYDATQDPNVLPRLRQVAIATAQGQNTGGTWGHGFAGAHYNAGDVFMRNGGYGAMNNCGGRAFAMLTLAQKAGVDHPDVDTAIRRSALFFHTYVDRGAVPYGFHTPVAKDDANGKNMGPAFGFHVLGDHYAAKYYGQNSSHGSFSRRGGHGSRNLWHYTPYAGALAGPEGVQTFMRNMRWFYTLARRHDGSFVIQGEDEGISGHREGMSATAYYCLYYCHPLKQTVLTGKSANKKEWHTPRELERLIISARPQLQDPYLIKKAGKPAESRSSDELLELLDIFFPKSRHAWAKVIGQRIKDGERETLPKAVALLESEDARYRDAGLMILKTAGNDAILAHMSKVVKLLKDPQEYVRMAAVKTLSTATGYDPNERYQHLLEAAATADSYEDMTMDHGNLRRAVLQMLFGGGKRSKSKFLVDPFVPGVDEKVVAEGLAKIIMMDPGGFISRKWTKDAAVRLAGPLTHVAEFEQVNDAMFAGSRISASQSLLTKHNFREGLEGIGAPFIDRSLIPRYLSNRQGSTFGLDAAPIFKAKGKARFLAEPLEQLLREFPTAKSVTKTDYAMLADVYQSAVGDTKSKVAPSLKDAAAKRFRKELAAVEPSKQIAYCRAELKDPESFWTFRQMAAMDALAQQTGPDVIDDVLPHLVGPNYRLRAHAHKTAVLAVKSGALSRFIELLKDADDKTIARALPVLADAGKGLDLLRANLKHSSPRVQKSAIENVFALDAIGGFDAVQQILKTADDRDVLAGCEVALLSKLGDAAHAKRTVDALVPLLGGANVPQQEVIAYVLGRFGGERATAALKKMAIDNEGALRKIAITGLSHAPEREVDQILLELARRDSTWGQAIADPIVRRMVIGPKGFNDVTDAYRVKLARQFLAIHYSGKIINYLTTVNTPAAVALLFDSMKEKHPTTAAQAIISNTKRMGKLSPKESQKIAKTLTQVMEFIEVSYLRDGATQDNVKEYIKWGRFQKIAGKTLLKFHKPETIAPPDFDEGELDF